MEIYLINAKNVRRVFAIKWHLGNTDFTLSEVSGVHLDLFYGQNSSHILCIDKVYLQNGLFDVELDLIFL